MLASICRYRHLHIDTPEASTYGYFGDASWHLYVDTSDAFVVAPLTQSNLHAADSESDDSLILSLRNGKRPRYSAPMRTGIQGITLDSLVCMTVNVPGGRTCILQRTAV